MDACASVCVCVCVCVCAEQTALAGFLLESPGQKTHESAASRIYSQLIKLAFVLLLGQQPVSINTHTHTHTHTHIPTWANKHAPVHRRAVTEAEGRETRQCGKRRWEKEKKKRDPPRKRQTISGDVNKST